jgi:hypothetical protein
LENRGIAEGVELDRTHGLLLSASCAGRAPSEKRVNLARTQIVAPFVPFDGRIRALASEVALEGQGLMRRTDRIATSGRDEDACFGEFLLILRQSVLNKKVDNHSSRRLCGSRNDQPAARAMLPESEHRASGMAVARLMAPGVAAERPNS